MSTQLYRYFFKEKSIIRNHTIVLLGLGELEIGPYLLDLAGVQGMEKPVKKRSVKGKKQKGRWISVRSGNEKDGNEKGWEKSSQI